jgi:two-component system, cell cycle sensor histidine kinase and response regulator CckA
MTTNENKEQRISLLGSLTAGVIHDLNNLFTGVSNYLNILSIQISHPSQQSYIENIKKSLCQGQELTANLLNFIHDTNDENGSTSLERLEELANLVKYSLKKQILFHLSLPKPYFPLGISCSELSQIFLNLIINAEESIDQKGEISVKGHYIPIKKKIYFLLEVTDTGVGIPANKLKAIFSSFYTTKEKEGGLGLSIVKSLVENVGGFIKVESTPNLSTKFKVYIPTLSNRVVESKS